MIKSDWLETLEELEWIEEISLSYTNETLIPNSKHASENITWHFMTNLIP